MEGETLNHSTRIKTRPKEKARRLEMKPKRKHETEVLVVTDRDRHVKTILSCAPGGYSFMCSACPEPRSKLTRSKRDTSITLNRRPLSLPAIHIEEDLIL